MGRLAMPRHVADAIPSPSMGCEAGFTIPFSLVPPTKQNVCLVRSRADVTPAQDILAARRFKGSDGCGYFATSRPFPPRGNWFSCLVFRGNSFGQFCVRYLRTPFPLCRHGARRDEFAGCYGGFECRFQLLMQDIVLLHRTAGFERPRPGLDGFRGHDLARSSNLASILWTISQSASERPSHGSR